MTGKHAGLTCAKCHPGGAHTEKQVGCGDCHAQQHFLPTVKDVFDERLRIEEGNKYLCSIGSCGQPRDYDPRACYGIWDDKDKVVEFRRVPYDAEKTARKILEAGLSHHFARRLLHGV